MSRWPLRPGVREFERKQLLDRVERETATVGAAIPEEVTLDVDGAGDGAGDGADERDRERRGNDGGGRPFRLREFVFEVKRRERVPPDERDRVDAVTKSLRRERLARKQRLESEPMPYAEGERLVEEIAGLDRALEALGSLGPTDVEADMEAAERADTKRWHSFLKRALGEDESAGRPGP